MRTSTIAGQRRSVDNFHSLAFQTGRLMSSTEIQALAGSPSMTIRAIRFTDMDMEAAFVRRLSSNAKHFRFLGGVKELSPQMLKAFCDVDGHHSMAFVATEVENGEETEIGVSRYAPNAKADVREMALTVADDWLHKGVGALLTKNS